MCACVFVFGCMDAGKGDVKGQLLIRKGVGIICVAVLQPQQKCHSLIACRPADGLEQMISKNFSKSKIL